MIERLSHQDFDVLVVGGGITGAGVALDAATRGLRTALVEADDFASGTSSKSSKLVHGGLRYLQQGDVRLVYEALHERQRLRRNAPHLVKLLPFMIPILTRDGLISRRVARALGSAMWMYDLTGGFRIGKLHKRLDAERGVRPPADDAAGSPRRRLPVLRRHDRRCPARASRRAHGGAPRRGGRQPVPGGRADEGRRTGRSSGAVVDVGDRQCVVRARAVVNAAGVWSDEVRGLRGRRRSGFDPPGQGHPPHRPVGQGAQRHRRRDPGAGRQAQPVRRAVGPADRRHVRAHLRRHDRHRLRRPARRPAVHRRRHRLRAAGAERVVTTGITADDVTGVWAGLRPLVKSEPGNAHRRSVPAPPRDDRNGRRGHGHRRQADDLPGDGRGHRRRGRRAARSRRPLPHQEAAAARRRRVPRAAAAARSPPTSATATGRSPARSTRSSPPIRRSARRWSTGCRTCAPRRCTRSATRWRRRSIDVLIRRTRAHLFDRAATTAAAPAVGRPASRGELGWDEAEIARQVERLPRPAWRRTPTPHRPHPWPTFPSAGPDWTRGDAARSTSRARMTPTDAADRAAPARPPAGRAPSTSPPR